MKRTHIILIVTSLILILILSACSKSEDEIKMGIYYGNGGLSHLSIEEDNTFVLNRYIATNYNPFGSYTIDGDKLLLLSNEGIIEFKINGDILIYESGVAEIFFNKGTEFIYENQPSNSAVDIMFKKDEKIRNLEKLNEYKNNELIQLRESLNMVRFSSYARLDDYDDIFDNLQKKYKINSEYLIKDDWYVIEDEYFQIELLGYEEALKVDFYTLRMESNEGEVLLFTDKDSLDGWIYTNDNISEKINKHK